MLLYYHYHYYHYHYFKRTPSPGPGPLSLGSSFFLENIYQNTGKERKRYLQALKANPWGPLYRNKNKNETKYGKKNQKNTKYPVKNQKRGQTKLSRAISRKFCACVWSRSRFSFFFVYVTPSFLLSRKFCACEANEAFFKLSVLVFFLSTSLLVFCYKRTPSTGPGPL